MINIIKMIFVFLISFCGISYYFGSIFFQTILSNPYKIVLSIIAILYVIFLSLVPTFFIYFLSKKREGEYILLTLGSFLGLAVIYGIESWSTTPYKSGLVMGIYVGFHNYLFNLYKINIYFLDYGGFGILVAGLSAALFALLPTLGYIVYKKLRTKPHANRGK